jgi:intein/homing endonuclease
MKDPHYDYTKDEIKKHLVLLEDHLKSDPCPECVVPDTLIFSNPSLKPISSLTNEDFVLTHKGDFKKVNNVFTREYKGKVIRIHPNYGSPITLTYEHPILTVAIRTKQQISWRIFLDVFKNYIDWNKLLQWKNASEINENDFLIFPRVTTEKDLNEIKIKTTHSRSIEEISVKVDQNLMELIGYYLAEGSCGKYKRGGWIEFSFGTNYKEFKLAQRVKELLKKCFNYNATIHKKETSFSVGCYKRIFYEFFKQFGENCYKKQLPSWVVYLPENKILSLLKASILGDGTNNRYSICYSTVSPILASQLRIILFRIGVLHSLYRKNASSIHSSIIKGRKIIARKDLYEIRISGRNGKLLAEKIGMKIIGKDTSGNLGYILDNFILIPIRKIEICDYDGYVYNLEVDKDETYCTSSFLVHNCVQKHISAIEGYAEEGTSQTDSEAEKLQFLQLAEKARELRKSLDSLKISELTKKLQKVV